MFSLKHSFALTHSTTHRERPKQVPLKTFICRHSFSRQPERAREREIQTSQLSLSLPKRTQTLKYTTNTLESTRVQSAPEVYIKSRRKHVAFGVGGAVTSCHERVKGEVRKHQKVLRPTCRAATDTDA